MKMGQGGRISSALLRYLDIFCFVGFVSNASRRFSLKSIQKYCRKKAHPRNRVLLHFHICLVLFYSSVVAMGNVK